MSVQQAEYRLLFVIESSLKREALVPYALAALDAYLEIKNPRWHEQPRMPAGVPEGGRWIDDGILPAGWGLLIRPVAAVVRAIKKLRNTLIPLMSLPPLDVLAPIPPRLAFPDFMESPSLRRPLVPYLEFDHYFQFWAVMGSAGKGYNWHHLVEQSTVANGQFPPRAVHNTDNIVRVTVIEHRCINRRYRAKNKQGSNLRNDLRGKTWQEHFSTGLAVLRECRYGYSRRRR
jgi:hypothetical protein